MTKPEAAPGVCGSWGEVLSTSTLLSVIKISSSDYDKCGPSDLVTLFSKLRWRKAKAKGLWPAASHTDILPKHPVAISPTSSSFQPDSGHVGPMGRLKLRKREGLAMAQWVELSLHHRHQRKRDIVQGNSDSDKTSRI